MTMGLRKLLRARKPAVLHLMEARTLLSAAASEKPWHSKSRVGIVGLASLLILSFWSVLPISAGERDIVINEIMYHPPAGQDKLQFIELFNRGTDPVELSNWSFKKGIRFTFPGGAKLAGGAYLVVCADPASFTAHYGQVNVVLGPFEGRLSHKSERVELTDARGQVIDSIKYASTGAWPHGAAGYSSSLERICPFEEGDRPENWAASLWPEKKRAAGSPGQRNSCFSSNLPPAILDITFSPKAPSPTQPVTVMAKITSAHGLRAVELVYRVATSGRESDERSVPMTRVSGDDQQGIFQAIIEPQPQGRLVRFRIAASDTRGDHRSEPAETEPRPTYSYFSFGGPAPEKIPLGYLVDVGRLARGPGHYQRGPARRTTAPEALRGNAAFLYVPPDGAEPETFDYVKTITRSGGFKVHFQKDRAFKGMTGINLISEGSMRWILSEPLSYVLYRMAGVPAELTEHVRLTIDGRLLGFYLLIEQPNKSFLVRNGRDDSGNLYKLIWYEHGIVHQHEKKTNPSTGHEDVVQLIEGLNRRAGAEQWAFIEKNFNVDEFINYYAVNMCIQNWDGFFNNYFTYHDSAGTGKWEIYPWDEDKTWGDYDGASPRYDWYEMPLTFGMSGDRSPRDYFHFGGGPFGGVSWWRPPGYFSGPLLANPEFRRRFLIRLHEICTTIFTEQNFFPIIDAMEKRLQPETRWRAQAMGQDPRQVAQELALDMQSFRNQVQHRRRVILNAIEKQR